MGKGGGKGHTPVEAKDNLKSTQMMSVIDAIGEGPVDGPEIIIIKLYRIVLSAAEWLWDIIRSLMSIFGMLFIKTKRN